MMDDHSFNELQAILKEQIAACEQIGNFIQNHYSELEARDTYNHWVNTWLGHKVRIERIKKLLEKYNNDG